MFRIECDITYQDGTLAGLTIPGGFFVNVPEESDAVRIVCWLQRTSARAGAIRAAVTGSHYRFTSCPRVSAVGAPESERNLPLAHRTEGAALCRISLAGNRAWNDVIAENMAVRFPETCARPEIPPPVPVPMDAVEWLEANMLEPMPTRDGERLRFYGSLAGCRGIAADTPDDVLMDTAVQIAHEASFCGVALTGLPEALVAYRESCRVGPGYTR